MDTILEKITDKPDHELCRDGKMGNDDNKEVPNV